MSRGRVFITGFGGQIGTDLTYAAADWDILAAFHHHPGRSDVHSVHLDITDYDKVKTTLLEFKPDIIFHAASLTNVDLCEKEKQKATLINADATQHLARMSERLGSLMVYFSTDFVFDGSKGNYREGDEPHPINHYGETKLLGERFVQNGIIARTSVVYSSSPYTFNFARWVITELRNNRKINVVTDQYGCPSLSSTVALAAVELCKKNERGIFHVCGTERVSRYEFALRVAEIFGLNADLISPILTKELHQLARRPYDSSLNTEKTSARIKTPLLNTVDGLQALKREMENV